MASFRHYNHVHHTSVKRFLEDYTIPLAPPPHTHTLVHYTPPAHTRTLYAHTRSYIIRFSDLLGFFTEEVTHGGKVEVPHLHKHVLL